jgi:Mg2+/Co2+ transporter CorB
VVEDLLSRPRRLLVTVLIGVETSSIVFSVLATSMVLSLWGPHGEWLVLLVIAPTFQFLGEIIPKSLALAYPARFAGRMAPLIKPVIFILSPFRVVFLQISRGILVALADPDH